MRRRGTFVARRRNDANWIEIGLFFAVSLLVAVLLASVLINIIMGLAA